MSTQLVAFEHVLSACEGTVGDEGYQALFGWRPGNGKVFTSFADHPRQYFPYTDKAGNTIRTSAAGKYQATVATWDDFIRERGPHDFSPASQDEFAEWLITKCGAMPDVEAGRLQEAIDKCGGRWASLPSSTVAQPHRSYDFCVAVFKAAGGRIYTERDKRIAVTPVPQEAPKMGAIALPLLAQLIPQVLQLFSGRAQAQLGKVVGDPAVAGKFMQDFIGKVGEVVGVPVTDGTTAVQAVATLTSKPDPAQVQALEDHALDYLDKLAPLIDKIAVHEAAARADTRADLNDAPVRKIPNLVTQQIVILLIAVAAVALAGSLVAVTWMLLDQIKTDPAHRPDAVLSGLAIMLVTAVASIAQAPYRAIFGALFNSGAADVGTTVVTNVAQTKGVMP